MMSYKNVNLLVSAVALFMSMMIVDTFDQIQMVASLERTFVMLHIAWMQRVPCQGNPSVSGQCGCLSCSQVHLFAKMLCCPSM